MIKVSGRTYFICFHEVVMVTCIDVNLLLLHCDVPVFYVFETSMKSVKKVTCIDHMRSQISFL